MCTHLKLLRFLFLALNPLLIHSYMFDDRILSKINDRVQKQRLLSSTLQSMTENVDVGTALFLTPLIEKGDFQQAQTQATVPPLVEGVESFAGYITVNKSCNSNLFFWMFKSMEGDWKTKPLIVWLQGGPGGSSMFGNLREIGPFFVNEKGELQKRQYAWNKSYNTMFIDNPVGTGYSFTNSCYCTTDAAVGRDLYEFTVQFYDMFPELAKNKFYIAGESYAGKYIPSWSHQIYLKNKENEASKGFIVPLAGILLISAWSDPINMLLYGDFVYQLGFADRALRDKFHSAEDKIRAMIRAGQFGAAWTAWNTDILDPIMDTAGLKTYYNYINDKVVLGGVGVTLTKPEIRKAIHVGNREFVGPSEKVYNTLKPAIATSVRPLLEDLLNSGTIEVVSLSAQLDIICAFPLVENGHHNLEWKHAAEYKTAKRCQYKIGDNVIGYYKNVGTFTELVFRNCGHILPADCPEASANLMDMIVTNVTGLKCV